MAKPITLTEDEYNRLLEREKKLVKMEDRAKNSWRKRNARLMLLARKAIEKGIAEPTESEINQYIKLNSKKK